MLAFSGIIDYTEISGRTPTQTSEKLDKNKNSKHLTAGKHHKQKYLIK